MAFKLNIIIFLIAFLSGYIFVYFSSPPITRVIKYPTLENAGKTIYIDRAHNCYTYIPREVLCPTDEKDITVIPPQ